MKSIPTKSCVPSGGKPKLIPRHASQRASKPKKHTQRDSDAYHTDSSTHDIIMPKGGHTVNLLPAIIMSSRGIYLATLFNALYASEEPFDGFAKSSPKFLDISRQAFGCIWPGLKSSVETSHTLFNFVSRFALAIGYGSYFTHRDINALWKNEARFMRP